MSEVRDDTDVIRGICSQDAQALGELYDRYGRLVFAVIFRMLSARDVAEEVTQDVFHTIWRRADSYRADRGAVRGWILTIARNAAIDWRRSKRSRVEREAPIDEAGQMSGGQSVEDQVDVRLRDGRVRNVVRALPEEQRRVLDLAFWGGLSQSEISTRTGVPLGTVKSRVRLAMAKLKDGLAEEVGET
ncbi:MAG: sigma-70 family RNA polymerase sigma factor [Chloroflexota bacterium]|nr:sigma-70 family RNA polymerase sigma factor [Chloroflexota bacterium]